MSDSMFLYWGCDKGRPLSVAPTRLVYCYIEPVWRNNYQHKNIFERKWWVVDRHTKASKKRRQLWTRSTSPAELDSEHICIINEDTAPSSRRWLLHCTTFTRYEMVSLRCFGLAEPSFSQESSKYPISFYKKEEENRGLMFLWKGWNEGGCTSKGAMSRPVFVRAVIAFSLA